MGKQYSKPPAPPGMRGKETDMTATRQQLIAACEQLAPMAEKVTEEQRINAASRITNMIPCYGPSWTSFVTVWMEHGKTMRSMSAAQFRSFLAAKREFALAARNASGQEI